eukprot:XP_014771142.1 PREDICTED: uncharacterized protein LOC106869796 [Octopus bimaculoides]
MCICNGTTGVYRRAYSCMKIECVGGIINVLQQYCRDNAGNCLHVGNVQFGVHNNFCVRFICLIKNNIPRVFVHLELECNGCYMTGICICNGSSGILRTMYECLEVECLHNDIKIHKSFVIFEFSSNFAFKTSNFEDLPLRLSSSKLNSLALNCANHLRTVHSPTASSP